MCSNGLFPSSSVEELATLLNECRLLDRNLSKALHLHTHLCQRGLEKQSLGHKLVRVLVECDGLFYACQVFQKLEHNRDGSSWNWLITGYMEKGHYIHGFSLYGEMQRNQNLKLSPYTYVAMLQACIALKDVQMGSSIHAEICRISLSESDIFIATTLVDMYSKCGFPLKAEEVFYSLPYRDVVLWTVLIAAHVERGHDEEAIVCIQTMQDEDVSPDAFTYVCGLRACSSLGSIEKGHEIYTQIVVKGVECELLVANTLVDMYVKFGLTTMAKEIFDKIRGRSVVSWNILLGGYLDSECGEKAIDCYTNMESEGVSGDAITFVCVLKACGAIGSLTDAYQTHAAIVIKGLENASLIGNTLVDFYAKCGLLADSKQVFEKLPTRDSVSWSAFLSGLANHGYAEDALCYLETMRFHGISLNSVSSICILKACISVGATIEGRDVHTSIIMKGLDSDLLVANALVDMYSKFGWMAMAQKVFDEIERRDVVSWNALISGYVEQDCSEQVMGCIEDMELEGISADAFTLDCCLKACGSIGAIDNGRRIHAVIVYKGLDTEHFIRTTLVDMHAKCGLILEAQELFDRLPNKDIVSTTMLLAGYSQLGDSETVFDMFRSMIIEHIMPNLVTFLSILNVCSHVGLVNKAEACFQAIIDVYGFVPNQEHYTCMVDALGRAGLIDKAIAMIRDIPSHPGIVAWHCLLGACKKWGHVDHGRNAFEEAVRLDGNAGATYVCMSNIYVNTIVDELKEDG